MQRDREGGRETSELSILMTPWAAFGGVSKPDTGLATFL
jgi:hypothetical protein